MEAFERVLDSGWYVLGQEVQRFEKEFADFVGVTDAVGVGSGTDALELALRAFGVGVGDEVILPSNALPTAFGVVATGCRLRFCDVSRDDYNLDPTDVAALLTPRTKAIVAVHLYGHPADIPALRKVIGGSDVTIIEDCAQAHGAKLDGQHVGTLGDAAAFSFYPTKNLGALGDGGMVVSGDRQIAEHVRRLRIYGEECRYYSVEIGTNSRLDEVQAALLRVKLSKLPDLVERRRALASLYDELLPTSVTIPPHRSRVHHARHLYPILVERRDEARDSLQKRGIPVAIHYPRAAHDQPCFEQFRERPLPVTEYLSRHLLSLPLYPELGQEQVRGIAAAVAEVCGA
jgi:dTDP-4-amino-4,6-dideoxygalactose transaminase